MTKGKNMKKYDLSDKRCNLNSKLLGVNQGENWPNLTDLKVADQCKNLRTNGRQRIITTINVLFTFGTRRKRNPEGVKGGCFRGLLETDL